jgi:hypothetical protein
MTTMSPRPTSLGAVFLVTAGLARLSAPGAVLAQTPAGPPQVSDASQQRPAAGTAAPVRIDIGGAPAPLFDDPVWHGASDPVVVWMPGKGEDGKGEWWMYYTQRRATLPDPRGVDWVHGSAIALATSKDGLSWKYVGVVQGKRPVSADSLERSLGDPLASSSTWWAPT